MSMKADKEQVIDLWQTCFHDSEKFVSLYFNRVYREENTWVKEMRGKVVSALQMLPYSMTYGGKDIPVAYISGASTYPEARGKGLMTDLLTSAFQEMRRRGQLLSVLIPAEEWLYGFYHQTEYGEGMYCRNIVCPTGDSSPDAAALYSLLRITDRLFRNDEKIFTSDRLYDYFSRKMHERPYAVQHTKEDFELILQDLLISGGDLFVATNAPDEIIALAFVYPSDDNGWQIKDLLADKEEIENYLLDFLPSYYPHQTMIYRKIASAGLPYGMIRVIDAEAMLSRYAELHPKVSSLIHLQDCQLPHNTGYYCIEHGTCRREPDSFEDNTVLLTSMKELSSLLFTGQTVYMTLMLD